MSIFLETKRLIINTPELDDFDDLYALQSDADVMKYIGRGVRTQSDVLNGLEKAIMHYDKHGFSLGSVFEKESGEFVGRAGLIHLAYDDAQPEVEVGYALTKSSWNKGYATELTQALIKWAFKHLTIKKIVAVIKPENDRSRRVLEKVGMRYIKRTLYWDNEVALYEIDKSVVDTNKIKLVPAGIKDYPVIQNMARFYVYDMSEYLGDEEGWEIPKDGLYECIDFKKYWESDDNFPFLIQYDDELAGFVIVDKKGSLPEIDFNMAQFFILRKFKGKGIGKYVAHHCFNLFQGMWEVMVIPGNEGAYRFWRATIQGYTHRDYVEYTAQVAHLNHNTKNIFQFISPR